MAEIFAGIDGGAAPVEGIYAGVDGRAREVVKAYAGVDSRARLIWQALPPLHPVFGENSWEAISAASVRGRVPPSWTVGSRKAITLADGQQLIMQIYGLNHDTLEDGQTAGITLGVEHPPSPTMGMNSTGTNVGSFAGSERYSWLSGEFWNLLPTGLRAAVRPALKRTSAGGGSVGILTQALPIFLFSEVEIYGQITHSAAGEGSRYPIFTDGLTPIAKRLGDETGANIFWWQRSPALANGTSFCDVNFSGLPNMMDARASRGICFGVCV